MFRLVAPLLVSACALDDETSLMQGLKPTQQVTQGSDKSKAIANLLSTATTLLKNGATPDVVDFAQATLDEITSIVLPSIINASNADQLLVEETFTMFEDAIQMLSDNNNDVKRLHDAERSLSYRHKACRAEEETICDHKRRCDYDLYAIWRRFVEEESILREYSKEVEDHFCVEGANGTMWIFRETSVELFPPWIEQKPIVEHWEHQYDIKVPVCEEWYENLDDKTAECDGLQAQLERAACAHVNRVNEVRNIFAESWGFAVWTYQRIVDEVHCLEIDRWKEWRHFTTVQCLLDRTTERNGRPCEETTDEIVTEVTHCEQQQYDVSIQHLVIRYPVIPEFPDPCPTPPWEVVPAVYPWPGRCVPVVPQKPCDAGYIAQEYADLWVPPQPEFHEENSHCNQRPECERCAEIITLPICYSIFGHFASGGAWVAYPTPEHECHSATRRQIDDGYWLEIDAYVGRHVDPSGHPITASTEWLD